VHVCGNTRFAEISDWGAMSYRTLNLGKTQETLTTLVRRVEERFPTSSLAAVARELHTIAMETESKTQWISTPNYLLRGSVTALIAAIIGILGLSFTTVDWTIGTFPMTEFIQVMEAGFNDLLLMGAAIFFLTSIESRVKRARTLRSLNELRAIAHVIDMHQLTKDPTELRRTTLLTPSSPKRDMTAFELNRYLDYCSELLSLVSKLASIYAQHFPDGTVVSAINEIEALTTGLSRKIWQKIMILQSISPEIATREDASPLETRPKPAKRSQKRALSVSGKPRKRIEGA
jgi:hypothetical protein